MNSNIIIIVVLVLILFAAIRGSVKHFKGEGGCCGGGGSTVKEPDKKLQGAVIRTVEFGIEGMHCENCVARVKRAINRIDGASARVVLKKNKAIVSFDKVMYDDIVVKEIENAGYKVTGIKEL